MKIILIILSLSSAVASAAEFQSGPFKTSLIELYTSEGCSSCPPAEAWLAKIYQQGFDNERIVPLAFHVTYWDYLGWKDRFSKALFDKRQRHLVSSQGSRSIYTPQFFINAKSLRNVSAISSKLKQKQAARLSINATLIETDKELLLTVELKKLGLNVSDEVTVNIAAYENNIESSIKAGENKGRVARHQFVVREFQTATISLDREKQSRFAFKSRKQNWAGLVVFIESGGEVEQVLQIPLKKRT
ncbi:MAG: DUF1223 domain-containing protein [Gammaproteobacteria bacterium]|nr:DUF1223 domain-containing protein [Gammaproteobacteria bacterium]